ncbi:MAG: ParB/RepB/Spo0J family partition protein [Alphaproteobacteria bacterium]|nr:ParB/RepB/Spo0J family partition protein [Alphaproteobacteria bacterium]
MTTMSNEANQTETAKRRRAPARRLGRGLDAILDETDGVKEVVRRATETADKLTAAVESATGTATKTETAKVAESVKESVEESEATGEVARVALDLLQPNSEQPRRNFDDDAIASLADSIRAHGILQPIVVRPAEGGRYQIIAGERRWHAAGIAGLRVVPVIVREMDDNAALQAALVENLQREDLSPIEEARAYQRLMTEFRMSQDAIAAAVAKSRPYVTNMVRLLGLPSPVLDAIGAGLLSAAHGRALLRSANPARYAKLVIERSLSVSELERLMKRDAQRAVSGEVESYVPDWLLSMAGVFAYNIKERMKVDAEIRLSGRTRGRFVIPFADADQMRRVAMVLGCERLNESLMAPADPAAVENHWDQLERLRLRDASLVILDQGYGDVAQKKTQGVKGDQED